MSALQKLMQARIELQGTKLKKSGQNKFAGYSYFELSDFLPAVQTIFNNLKLAGVVSFMGDHAKLTITDIEDGSFIDICTPMASANLKGCHEVQNLGAVQTYIRRYLWVTALEIVEHDVLDGGNFGDAEKKEEKPKPSPTKPELVPSNTNAWNRAISVFGKDGNLKAVEEHMTISDENRKKLIADAKKQNVGELKKADNKELEDIPQ
ncbi:MAG: ERF family protein [Burkholderiales bacterium]|nr:ERF family protein [Burkholderiales bacterium]